jgi:hypothetical protein
VSTGEEIDYTPLTAPVDRSAVKAFRAHSKASGQPWAHVGASTVLAWVVVAFIAFVFLVVAGGVAAAVTNSVLSSGASVVPGFSSFAAFIVPVAVIAVVVITLVRRGSSGGKWGRWYRLDRFARANGLVSVPVSPDPRYSGSIFGIGNSREGYDRLQSGSGRFLDLGNYRYTTGSGKNRTTHSWGFLALQLDRRLPNMVLDARSNNGVLGATNLPNRFSRDQVLKLEGDFNRYFTLYCPREYERDALYVFTPDLMALLIDNANTFDVEIVDDWMFVYSPHPIDTLDPDSLRRMFRIANTVGAKTLTRTENYRDERMPLWATSASVAPEDALNFVAPPGRRLRKGTSGAVIVPFVIVAAVWFVVTVVIR